MDVNSFLAAAAQADQRTYKNGYVYGHATRWDGTNLWNGNTPTVSCDRGVALSLYIAGYHDLDPSQMVLEGTKLTNYLVSKGWKKITKLSEVQAGDVVYYDNDHNGKIDWRDHVFICAGTNSRYDWGSLARIRHQSGYSGGMPFNEPIDSSKFFYALRMPSADWAKIESGTYEIVSALDSGYALDLEGAKKKAGAMFRLWKRNHTNAQRFTVKLHSDYPDYAISVNCSGLVMETVDGRTDKGTQLRQLKWNGSPCQCWMFRANSDGTYTIFNVAAGLPIDVKSAKVAKGTDVRLWKDNGTNAQRWRLVKV